ncbi:hypothetical protein K461DRAFT_38585 [Myriangium duriaei CBS 260.36]|uniref:Uncharacterized protein n=1 Tax=Myriangium duriaei CBS 260.36 TaxID=1168546 RepID=A0A9P4MEC8_9PEZI|nr:hypothetical protein K461DRAFT_38585 [Myriangium duriaei CBS 260.36]
MRSAAISLCGITAFITVMPLSIKSRELRLSTAHSRSRSLVTQFRASEVSRYTWCRTNFLVVWHKAHGSACVSIVRRNIQSDFGSCTGGKLASYSLALWSSVFLALS